MITEEQRRRAAENRERALALRAAREMGGAREGAHSSFAHSAYRLPPPTSEPPREPGVLLVRAAQRGVMASQRGVSLEMRGGGGGELQRSAHAPPLAASTPRGAAASTPARRRTPASHGPSHGTSDALAASPRRPGSAATPGCCNNFTPFRCSAATPYGASSSAKRCRTAERRSGSAKRLSTAGKSSAGNSSAGKSSAGDDAVCMICHVSELREMRAENALGVRRRRKKGRGREPEKKKKKKKTGEREREPEIARRVRSG